MNHLSTKGLGALVIATFALTTTACGSSVILDADGDPIPDDEDGSTSSSSGSGASGPGVDPACAPGSSLNEIAPWNEASAFLALHDDAVFWTTDANIARAPRQGGGPVETLATPSAAPMGIDVDDSGVYVVVGDGTLIRLGLQGGPATTLASGVGLGGAFSVARVDADDVYFRLSCEQLARVSKEGGAVDIVAETAGCFGGFAIDDQHVYVVDQVGGSVARVAKDGGPSTTLVEGPIAKAGGYTGSAPGIAVDDDAVYWVSADGGFVGKVAKVGGAMAVVADGLVAVQDVAVADGLVYWSEQGRVGRATTDGEGELTLVDEPIGIVPMGLALDDERLFFTNYVTNGAVLSVCR